VNRFSEALITHVVVCGFRSLENVSVDLESVTVLVGPNSSGKSSFLEALAFLSDVLRSSPEEAFSRRGGIGQVITRTGKQPDTISLQIRIASRVEGAFSGTYLVKFRKLDVNTAFSVPEETCEMITEPRGTPHRFKVVDGEFVESTEGVKVDLAKGRLALSIFSGIEHFAPMFEALASVYLYTIEPHTIGQTEILGVGERLNLSGSNAASVLERLKTQDPTSFRHVMEAISRIVSSVQDIAVERQSPSFGTLSFEEAFLDDQRVSFNASDMSEGTLRALAILLATYHAKPPTLVAFEEPETAIHPGAAAVLAEALQEAGLRTQILITTHSPDFITRFDVESLRAVERTADGVTVIAPIAESQREAIRRRLFTAGEIHRMEGLRPSTTISEESSNDA
jgi:predicted ATPase